MQINLQFHNRIHWLWFHSPFDIDDVHMKKLLICPSGRVSWKITWKVTIARYLFNLFHIAIERGHSPIVIVSVSIRNG